MSDGRLVQDADGVVLSVETPGDVLFGWPIAELVGTHAPMLVHPDDREIASKVRKQVLSSGDERGVQIRVRTRSARWLWADCRFAPDRDESGEFGLRTVLEIRDVSARYFEGEALSLLVELRSLIDSADTFEEALDRGLERLAHWGGFDCGVAWEPTEGAWANVADGPQCAGETQTTAADGAPYRTVSFVAAAQVWAWADSTTEEQEVSDPCDDELRRFLLIPLVSNGTTIAVVELRGRAESIDERAVELLIAIAGQLGDAFRQHRIERELGLARRRFELAFDEAAIGMALIAPGGKCLDVNASVCALLGRSKAELIEIGFRAVTHPDDLEGDLSRARQVLRGELSTYQMEKRYIRADGEIIWGLLSISLVRDEVGDPLHFIAQIQDISDRKRAEVESARSVARFRAAFDDSPIAMALTRVDGRHVGEVVESNGRLRALAEGLGHDRPICDLADLLGAEAGVVLDRLENDLGEGTPVSSEGRLDGVNGERWVRFIAAPVGDVSNDLGRFAVVQIEDITEQRRAQDRLAHSALHDALTDLPNRTLISSRLAAAQRRSAGSGCHVGVLLIDLDNFKAVNDSLGHHAGDQLLEEVARRFVGCLRPSDTAARLGGDEFVILCDGLSNDPARALVEVDLIAQRVHDSLDAPVELDDTAQWVTASVGTHVMVGDDEPVHIALSGADVALYEAKMLGRSQTAIYDEELRRKAQTRTHISRALGRALPDGQLHLAYQPIVDLGSRNQVGAEALLRWNHPSLGSVPPDQFIEVAEHSNIIVQLGEYVTDQVCATLAHHPRLGQVAMNVSARQLARSDFVHTVMSALECHGTPASRLSIELTENMLIGAADSSLDQLNELKELGVAIGVDDFGTGYASLTYLKNLPITFVKIDRSFVEGIVDDRDDRLIVNAVIGLANDLGLSTIAEGIEREDQARILEEMGCPFAQGYFFGRPAPLEDAVGGSTP